MAQRTTPPSRTGKPIAVRRSADALTRLKAHRWHKQIDPGAWFDNLKALAVHYAVCSPAYIARGWWRRADWLAVPTLAALAAILGVNWQLALPVAAGWLLYRAELSRRHLPPPIANRVNLRRRLRWQRKLNPVTPRLTVTEVIPEGHRTVLRGRVPVDIREDDVRGIREHISRLVQDRTDVTFPVLGRFELHVRHDDILSREPDRPTLDSVLLEVGAGRIPIAVDREGQTVWWEPNGHHLIVAGMTGAGKSTTLKSILDYARYLPHVQFRVFAAKGRRDFGWFDQYAEQVTVSVEDTVAMLEATVAEMDARVDQLPPGPYTPSTRHPLIILVLDEYIGLFGREAAPPVQKRAAAALSAILRKGRDPGYTVLAATQDLHKTQINSDLIGQFVNRLGLYVADPGQSEAITGTKRADADLSKLPRDQPGRGLWIPGFIPVRTFRHLSTTCTNSPQEAVRETPTLGPSNTPELVPQTNTGPTADELRTLTAGKLKAEGGLGVRLKDLAAAFDVPDHRIKSALNWLRARDQARYEAGRWYWTGDR